LNDNEEAHVPQNDRSRTPHPSPMRAAHGGHVRRPSIVASASPDVDPILQSREYAALQAEIEENLVDGMLLEALKAEGKSRGTDGHLELKRRVDWLRSKGAIHPDQRAANREKVRYEAELVGRLDEALSEWTDHRHERERVIRIVMPFIEEARRK
jgi:hypothetical protein